MLGLGLSLTSLALRQGGGGAILFSGQSVSEGSGEGDPVGTLSASGPGDWRFTLLDDAGGRFAIEQAPAAYIQTHHTGLKSSVPSNLRTGLSTATYGSGGFVEELTIAVTGEAGSRILTTAETTKVAGLGSTAFNAVLNADDGSADFFVMVMSHNGSTEITLYDALEEDFVGELVAKWDAGNGQHLTFGGTRAWARLLAEAEGLYFARGRVLGGTFFQRGSSQVGLAANAALTAYGNSNSAAPVVSSGLQNASAANILDATSGFPVRIAAYSEPGKIFGCHEAGHGGTFTFDANGADVVLETFVSAYRASTDLVGDGVQVEVRVEADGVDVYERTQDFVLQRHAIRVQGATQIKLHVTNLDGAIYYIGLFHLTVREAGAEGLLIRPGDTVVTMLDSWGQFYGDGDGEFESYLETLTGATVLKHSVGGITSEYIKSWIEERALSVSPLPDAVIIGAAVNDSSNLYNITYTDPAGAVQPMWPYNMAAAQIDEHYKNNLAEIEAECVAAGIRPIFLLPSATASGSQAQTLAGMTLNAEPLVPHQMKVLATEISNAHSFVNQYGKVAGVRHYDITNSRWMVANGSGPLVSWTQEGGGVTVTPTDMTAPTFRNGTTRTVAENAALDMVISTNEPSAITITGGADQAFFSLAPMSDRAVHLQMAAKDYEAPVDADANNTYVVQLTATDPSSNATNQTVTVTVTNVVD